MASVIVRIALMALFLMIVSIHFAVASTSSPGAFIEFAPKKSLRSVVGVSFSKTLSRADRREHVVSALKNIARESQASVKEILDRAGIKYRSFWITNSIYVETPSKLILSQLQHHQDIRQITYEKIHRTTLVPTIVEKQTTLLRSNPQWNIQIMQAHLAWDITRGENVTVAIIDTGVRYTHQALVGSYRGNLGNNRFNHDYNWFDPQLQATSPSDENGHGTHVMGTIAGSQESGIGVAPGVNWIASKGCSTFYCSDYDLTASAEWVLCPTKIDGTGEDCSLGADIVSNSWGGGSGDDFYRSYVDAWEAAGIIPVFAMGNAGPSCKTAGSPGDYNNVIGVGATTDRDALASFSSRGPGPSIDGFSQLKPDVSAPGSNIVSASSNSDSGYETLSGTSMATPAVSGVIALMLSVNPRLFYQDVYAILTEASDRSSLSPPNGGDGTCNGIPYNTFPNNHYGYGRVNALSAVSKARSFSKD